MTREEAQILMVQNSKFPIPIKKNSISFFHHIYLYLAVHDSPTGCQVPSFRDKFE